MSVSADSPDHIDPGPRYMVALRLLTVSYWLALFALSHWPRLDVTELTGMPPDALPGGVDKWGHVIAYALLTGAVLTSRLFGRRGRATLRALLIVLTYSAVDELTQGFIPGRYLGWNDWFASVSGIVLGSTAWLLVGYVIAPGQSFVDHARTVSLITLLSRLFGLVRDWALAFAFGFTGVLDAFVIAFMIPNLFRRLFGEGALAAAFIPHYTKLNRDQPEAADGLARWVIQRLWTWLYVAALVASLVCLGLYASGSLDARGQLAAGLTGITIWYAPLVCVTAILGAMLQVHHRFGVPAAAPVLLNICLITSALVVALWPNGPTPEQGVVALAIATVVAGLLQVGWSTRALRAAVGSGAKGQGPGKTQPPPLRGGKRGGGFEDNKTTGPSTIPQSGIRDLESPIAAARRSMMRQWLPTVVGLAVFQLNVLADSLIALIFSGEPGQRLNLFGFDLAYPMQTGSVAVLGATARLYEFPLGVFGIAVATAIFPALSAAASDRDRFVELLRQGLRLTVFIGLPASVGLVLVRYPLARAIYYGAGRMTDEDAGRIAWVLLGYAPAVWAYSMNQLLTRAFYAHHNSLTPMRVSVAMVGLNIALNLTLIWLPVGDGERLGAAGLAWSTAICAAIQCIVLLRLMRRYAGAAIDRNVAVGWVRSGIATLVMAVVVYLLIDLLPGWTASETPMSLADLPRPAIVGLLAGAVVSGALSYGLVARLLAMAELGWVLRRRSL